MANVDPDQTPHSAAADLGLHCLLMPVSPNAQDKYGITGIYQGKVAMTDLGLQCSHVCVFLMSDYYLIHRFMDMRLSFLYKNYAVFLTFIPFVYYKQKKQIISKYSSYFPGDSKKIARLILGGI